MNFYSALSQIFFLPADATPPILPVYPSQIKMFDVYYTYEPVVGVHVLGSDAQSTPVSIQATVDFGEIAFLSLQVING